MKEQREEKSNQEQDTGKRQAGDINEQMIIKMRDISRTMRRLYEGKASQKRILILLNEVQSMTQRELTRRLGIQPGSASEVIAKLESAGLLTRTPGRADRRTMDLVLTKEGRDLALEAAEQRNVRHKEMFSCLSEDEKTVLLELLEKIHSDWESRYKDAERQKGRKSPCGNT